MVKCVVSFCNFGQNEIKRPKVKTRPYGQKGVDIGIDGSASSTIDLKLFPPDSWTPGETIVHAVSIIARDDVNVSSD